MPHAKPDTEELVKRAAGGDGDASQQLLARHRARLKRMASIRIDRRLANRIDPSDIVQDTLIVAARRLPAYLRDQSVPFYPWIRQLALQQIINQYRRHVRAGARSVRREEQHAQRLPDHSAIELAVRLLSQRSSPSDRLAREEIRERVQRVLGQMTPGDREVLALRFLEQLSTSETAAVLGLTVNGVKSRQARALERFTHLFAESSSGGDL